MPEEVGAFVHQHLRFNFIVGMLDGGAFGFGLGFGSFAAVIPLFVHHLTDSALLIGLVPAIHNIGWQLPQLLTAPWLSGMKRYKPLVLLLTIHERLPFLGLALVGLLLPQMAGKTALIVIFLLLIWQGIGAGLTANPWTNLISKVIPNELHGTFFGTQSAAGNAMGGISAILAGLILDRVAGPGNFSICFALTFVWMAVSYVFLACTREPHSEPRERESTSLILNRSLEILRRDSKFRSFLLVRALSQVAGMAFSFYIIYAVSRFGMSDAAASIMVSLLLIGQIFLSPLMGRWGDRWSHRGVMVFGAAAASLSAVLAAYATSASWFYGIFLLQACAVVAIWTIPIAFSVSFAKSAEDRPLYIGLANTIPAPATILAPVLGGFIADAFGYSSTFILSAAGGLLMVAALMMMKD